MPRRTTAPESASESEQAGTGAGSAAKRASRPLRSPAPSAAKPAAARAASAAPPRRIRPTTSPVAMLGCDVPSDYTTMVQYAMALSRATVGVPELLQRSPENVISVMTIARAIQLPMAVVFQNVFSHEKGRGQVGERSRLLHMLARRAGHRLVIEHLDDTECRGVLWVHDQKNPVEVSYTILEAQKMGLLEPFRDKNGNWTKQPANMLRNRWVTRCVDWHVPEVKMGADFAADGGLLIEGVNEDEDVYLTGLGPEITRLLNETASAERLPDATSRYARLRGIWADARMLRDSVIDEEGTTLEAMLAAKLAEARQDAEAESAAEAQAVDLTGSDQPAGKDAGKDAEPPVPGTAVGKTKAARLLADSRARREAARREQAEAEAARQAEQNGGGTMPCGCDFADVAATGSHAATCDDLTQRLLSQEADRR